MTRMSEAAACRIVLCDDSRGYVALLRVLVELEPAFELVGEAYDGRQAIEVCAQVRPDLLVLDVSMPEMDGLTAIPHVQDASPGTTIVMLTGFDSPEVRRQALELGAAGYLEKGLSATELVAALRSFAA
jgi:DNA-binding NarL/FixJ family response regulator